MKNEVHSDYVVIYTNINNKLNAFIPIESNRLEVQVLLESLYKKCSLHSVFLYSMADNEVIFKRGTQNIYSREQLVSILMTNKLSKRLNIINKQVEAYINQLEDEALSGDSDINLSLLSKISSEKDLIERTKINYDLILGSDFTLDAATFEFSRRLYNICKDCENGRVPIEFRYDTYYLKFPEIKATFRQVIEYENNHSHSLSV